MPTIEGIVFISLGVFFFFWRRRLLFPLLIVSTVFEASSVVSSSSLGIQPYYCVAILFVSRYLIFGSAEPKPKGVSFIWIWVAFAAVSLTGAMLLPIIFRGTYVINPRDGMEDLFAYGPTPLQYQLSNFAQSAFLMVNVLVVLAATRMGLHIETAHKVFKWSAYLILFIVLSQALCLWLGLPFPNKLLNNNPGYSIVNTGSSQIRPSGSFTEPSVAGAVLVSILAMFLWEYFSGRSGPLKTGVAAAGCLLNASTSSLAAVPIILAGFVFAFPVFRFPWFIKISQVKRWSAFVIFAALCGLLILVPSIRDILASQTQDKVGSHSALVRIGADIFSIGLIPQTYGLGVGLGSNRPSSFVTSLLSQVGVAGFVLFACAVWKTVWPLRGEDRWISIATLALLLCMALGIPDLSFSYLWILLALGAQSKAASALPMRESASFKLSVSARSHDGLENHA